MTLIERYEMMLTCSDRFMNQETVYPIIDTRDHLKVFRSVAKGNVLEIGTDVGNSTTAFLLGVEENGGSVTSIDINPKCAENFPNHPQWAFILGSSRESMIRDRVRGRTFDVLFEDGDHSYEGVANDIFTYAPFVRLGGLILVHDVLAPDFLGVQRAFDEADFGPKTFHFGSWGLGVISKDHD